MNASYSHFYLRRLWYAWAAALAAIPLFYIGYHPVANVQHGPTRTSWVWLDAATAERMPTHENQFSGWVHIPDSGVIWLQNSIGAEVTLTIDGRVVYQGQQSQEITLDGSVPDPAAFRLSYALPDDFPVRGILSLSRKNVLGGKQPIPAWDYGRQSTTSLQARLYAGARWLALVAGALALLLAAASLRLSRRQRFLLGSIFILSLLVRLVSLAQKFDNDPTLWTMETVWDNYVLMGRSWLAGIVHVGGTIYQQGAFIYLGLAQMALGPDISHLYILNTVLGSFAPVLLTLAGWALIDRKTGMIAGLLSALFAPLIHYQQTLQIVAPATLLMCLLLAASAALYRWPHPLFALTSGLAIGLGTVFRSTLLFMLAIPFLALVIAPLSRRKRWIFGALILVTAALCIAPITISNVQAGEYVLTANLMDYQLFRSNNINSTGLNTYMTQSEQLTRARHEAWLDALWRDTKRDPRRLVELTIRRVALFWEAKEHSDSGMISYQITGLDVSSVLRRLSLGGQINFRLLMFFALIGIGLGVAETDTRRETGLLAVGMLFYILSLAAFYVIGRVRMPLAGIAILLTAIGLGSLPQWIRRPPRKRVYALGVIVGAAALTLSFNFLADNLPRPNFIDQGDLPSDLVPVHATYGSELELLGYAYYDSDFQPGGYLTFELFWRALQKPSDDYILTVRLINHETHAIDQIENFLLGTQSDPQRTTSQWATGSMFYERYLLTLPDTSASYDIFVGLYDQADDRLLPVQDANEAVQDNHVRLTAVGFRSGAPGHLQDAVIIWEHALALQKIDCHVQDGMLNFDLEWFAIKRPTRSAQMFVHVLKDGQMVTQRDGMPDETYPTDAWPPGTTVTTHWEIPGVETPVTIQFGLYDVFSDQRWTITAHDGLSAVDNYVEMACPPP